MKGGMHVITYGERTLAPTSNGLEGGVGQNYWHLLHPIRMSNDSIGI
jgi:hypothetical protein